MGVIKHDKGANTDAKKNMTDDSPHLYDQIFPCDHMDQLFQKSTELFFHLRRHLVCHASVCCLVFHLVATGFSGWQA